jgi:hypothetical protein
MQEMIEAVKEGGKELRVVEGSVEVIGAEAEEEVIIVVGTVEEMVFSWTFFGVFLFSLWRISRNERKWLHYWNRGERKRGEHGGQLGQQRYPHDRLFTPVIKRSRRRGASRDGGSVFSGVDPSLSEEDQEALELGRLMMKEAAAAEKIREATRNAAQR